MPAGLLQSALSVLVRHYEFELPENHELELVRGILPRPKFKGTGEGAVRLPLKVRRVE